MTARLTTYATPHEVGEAVGTRLLGAIASAHVERRRFLLGCPTGRTPKPIFGWMARRLAERPQTLAHVTLVMMDEYLVQGAHGLEWASAAKPWSCHHFAEHDIAGPLNASLPDEWRIAPDAAWFPDPRDPAEYDARIERAGGIDLFLLASGASDGHVAFNPPGSPRDSRTRIIPLSEETRRDNLQTFPPFGTLEQVPHHGVSVGIDTITRARSAIMVVLGAGKRLTTQRMLAATGYEPDWPATLIHECAGGEIIADAGAAG